MNPTGLYESVKYGHIDSSKLSSVQRIILAADGTLTEILEAYSYEKIHVIKLSEDIISMAQDIQPLDIKVGRKVIERKILLQGKVSQRNWLFAESILVFDRLAENFRERLLKSQEPMGKLWTEYKLETFKEIIASYWEQAEDLSDYFKINREDKLLCRTYRVFSNHKPIMMITEKFPASHY